MSLDEVLEKLFNEDVLVKTPTLISITLAILLLIILPIEAYIKDVLPLWYIRFPIYIILILSWWIFWYLKRTQLPETPDGKIGIVMAITTKDEKCKIRLDDDFIAEFKRQIRESDLHNLIHVVQTKNYQAERLKPILEEQESSAEVSPKWTNVQKKIKGHLYIWGTLKDRNPPNNNFILDYNVLVAHDKFEEKLKRELSSDIKQFWLQQFRIEEANEIEGFLDSATQYYLVAKYLIGYAALYSGANEAAFILHKSLEGELIQKTIPNRTDLLNRTKKHLSTEHFLFAYLSAVQGKSIKEIEYHLKNCLDYNAENGDAYIFKARLELPTKEIQIPLFSQFILQRSLVRPMMELGDIVKHS